jgi:hypothetical protein
MSDPRERNRTSGHELALSEIDNLRRSLLHALAERDDALWEIGRIDLMAQEAMESAKWATALFRALGDIRLRCIRALAGSKRIKEDE